MVLLWQFIFQVILSILISFLVYQSADQSNDKQEAIEVEVKQHRRNELFMGDEDMPIHSFHSLIGTY